VVLQQVQAKQPGKLKDKQAGKHPKTVKPRVKWEVTQTGSFKVPADLAVDPGETVHLQDRS
jgi:hypothetical protein